MNRRRNKTRWAVAFLATIVGFGALVPVPRASAVPTLDHEDSIDFGTVSAFLPRSVRFSNGGGQAAVIESATMVGDGFSLQSDGCLQSAVAIGGRCDMLLAPEPTGPGPASAILRVVHTGGTIEIPVSATYEIFEHVFLGVHRSESPDPTAAWLGWGVESAIATSSTLRVKTHNFELGIQLPTGEIFNTGAQWQDMLTKRPATTSWLDADCWGDGDVQVDDARYAPDGSVEMLTLSVVIRCDIEDVIRNVVVHVADIDDAGIVTGPNLIAIGRVLEGDRAGSAFIYNSTGSPVDADVSAAEVTGANVDNRCQAPLESHTACSVVVSTPLVSLPGSVTGTIALKAGAVEVGVSYQAAHETAAYLHRVAQGSSLALDAWDELAPGRHMIVRTSNPHSISFKSQEDANPTIGAVTLLASDDITPGRYEVVPGAPGPGHVDIASNFLCINRSGFVDVHEYETDGKRITRISASAVVYCNDGPLPADYIDLRYNVELDDPWIAVSDRDVRLDEVTRFEPMSSTVVVTNLGRGPGTVEAVVVGSPYISLGAGCVGAVLAPGQSCTLKFVAATDDLLLSHEEARIFVGITGGALGLTDIAVDVYFDTPDMSRSGYWVLQADGTVTPFGDAARLFGGDLRGEWVHIEPTWDGRGYWMLDSDGNVVAVANAGRFGSVNIELDPGERVTTMASTPDSRGYWVFTNRGRVMPFGNAPDIGDLLAFDLAGEIVASTSSPTGNGAYMIGSDGGVFALGDATFAGSIPQVLPGVVLDQPVVGLVADPDGTGYWMVAADGGVFAFDAPYRGSVPAVLPPGVQVAEPVNGMVSFFDGYLLVAADGGVFNFSSEPFQGSLAKEDLDSPVVAIAPLI